MAQSKIVCVALVTVLSVLGAQAQQPCQTATGMANINATQLAGYWFEVARAPAANAACIQINTQLTNNGTALSISTSSSSSNSSTYMNQHVSGSVNVTDVNANTGFNVTYNSTNAVNTTYKILDTDYSTYLVVCGYTSTNVSTSFGAILTTSSSVNNTWLTGLVSNTSQVLSNFNSSTVANVTQTNCYTSSASTSLPILSTLFAALYFLVKLIN